MPKNKPRVSTSKKNSVFAPHLSVCRCGNGTNQLEAISSSLAKLVAKRSVKIQGKGHLATETNGSNGLNEVQKLFKRSKEKGQTFSLRQNHLSSISLGQAFYWIWRKVTSLYDHFMETLTSQCFGECDRFFSFVQCSRSARNVNTLLETLLHLSFFSISYPKKLF